MYFAKLFRAECEAIAKQFRTLIECGKIEYRMDDAISITSIVAMLKREISTLLSQIVIEANEKHREK